MKSRDYRSTIIEINSFYNSDLHQEQTSCDNYLIEWEWNLVDMKIPKIIHQINTQGIKSSTKHELEAISELKSNNIDWEYRFYDEQQIFLFLLSNNQRYMDAYYSINPNYGAARADYFRYLIIREFGGAYFDVKSYTTASLNKIIQPDDEMVIFKWQGHPQLCYESYGIHSEIEKGTEHQQWNILSTPNNKYINNVVERVTQHIENYTPEKYGVGMYGVLRTTGPIAYTNAINELNCDDGIRFAGNNAVNHVIYAKNHYRTSKHYSQLYEPIILRE